MLINFSSTVKRELNNINASIYSQVVVTVCAIVKPVTAAVSVGLLLSLVNSTLEMTVAVILTTATITSTPG